MAVDLGSFIDWRLLECLNQKPEHPIGNALKQGYREDDGLFLESDTDEQLLVHIPFNQAVRLSAIAIRSMAGAQAPKTVKLFVNRPTLGFAEAADMPAMQDLALGADDLEGRPAALRLVKFGGVNVLTVLVADNQGDEDTTIIHKIVLLGSPGQTFNVAAIKDVSKEEG